MKEYYYKRIFLGESKHLPQSYFKYTKETVIGIRKSQEFDKSKGQQPQFILEEAKWWYYPYRYLKDNKAALWSLILVVIGAILGAIFTYLSKS